MSVTVAYAGLWLFDRWLWRLPLIRGIHGQPLLHGTWHGQLASDWVDPETGQGVAPDPDVFLVLRQTYWQVSARLLTKESKSKSVSASLARSPDGVCQLLYLYRNVPGAAVRHRSELHYGSVVLDTPGDRAAGLEGHYFTDRKTLGSLRFHKHFDEVIETYHQGMALLKRASAVECQNSP